jgi:hypothetical protein
MERLVESAAGGPTQTSLGHDLAIATVGHVGVGRSPEPFPPGPGTSSVTPIARPLRPVDNLSSGSRLPHGGAPPSTRRLDVRTQVH